ncbi:MAG TPA: ABC transporter permease [Bryobacteraceae bacterium]
MSLWREALRRLAYLGRRTRFDEDLDAEVEFHIETRADELEQSGLPRRDALIQARREFGSPSRMREDTRSVWQFRWLEDLSGDLRYAARGFHRNPAFALTAIVCLALGIGANTTIFSIAAEVLFSRPSVRDPETLAYIRMGGNSHSPLPAFRLARDAGIFSGLAGENENTEANWRHGDVTDRLYAIRVTDNFFDVTGMPVAMGRPIQAGDTDIVVLANGFWRSRLGADPNAIGRSLILDGRPYTVAGVLPRDHRTVTGFGFAPDLYMPLPDDRALVAFYGRMPAGMTRTIAAARLQAVSQELDRIYPNQGWSQPDDVSPVSGLNGKTTNGEIKVLAAFFAMLMIVVGLVLAIACANVASLLLARASSRSQELAIRLSIGAGRGRIVRQLFAESLLLALVGTAAGLALNVVLTAMLSRVRLPVPLPIQFLIEPDWRLLAYAVAVAFGCSVASGLVPAIKGTRAGIGAVLKQDERQVSGSRWSLRNVLVAGQLAVSIVLLSAAFLFMRNLVEASGMNPGFDVDHTIWAYMRLVPQSYPEAAKTRPLVNAALDRLRTVPGVEAAAIARVVPLNDAMNFRMPVSTDLDPHESQVRFNENYVGVDYFKTMRIPIVNGRGFLPSDGTGAARVAILNENMARHLFGKTDPVGHTLNLWRRKPVRIAGVAKNSKYFTLGEENILALYEPYEQSEAAVNLHFLIRATGNPQALIPAINAALNRLAPTAALETKTMQKGLSFALLPSRAGAAILGAMGLLGLALASIGLYGVLLYSVSRRIREIGLRVALGATPGEILRLVLGQSASVAATGIVIGMALAAFAVRPLAMFLTPEVRTTDISNFVAVGAVLAIVALLATISPAVRALRVDPVVALRHE